MSIYDNRNFKPMLLKEIDKPFDSKDYIFEIKYDGIRSLCFANNKEIKFMSRNNKDLTNLYPELVSIKDNINNNVIFDGEIIALDSKGNPSFSKLQERSHLKDKTKISIASENNPVYYMVFDIIYENKDITDLSLMKRKKILNKYPDTEYFIKTMYVDTTGIKLFKEIKKRNLEGIVAKEKNSTYHINKRTDDFIKIKNIKRDEFIIIGYKINEMNISLYLGEEKDTTQYVGKCSLSLNRSEAKKILSMKSSKKSFIDIDEEIIYLKDRIYCYITYTDKTKNNTLRHPVFKGLV